MVPFICLEPSSETPLYFHFCVVFCCSGACACALAMDSPQLPNGVHNIFVNMSKVSKASFAFDTLNYLVPNNRFLFANLAS